MTVQTVNVKLPRAMYRRLERLAATMHQSFDKVLLQTIRGNLPPSLDDLPSDLRPELSGFFNLSDDDLWAVAQSSVDARGWKEHQRLLKRNVAGMLTAGERQRLEHFRIEVDNFVARKSFAFALLKWRGYTLPIPADEAKRAAS